MKKPQSELSKQIKRINYRLREYEERGLDWVRDYKNLIKKAEDLGLELGKTKSGFTKVVNKKYDETQALGVKGAEKRFKTVSSVGKRDLAKAEKLGIDTKGKSMVEIVEEVEREADKTHDFIEQHKNDIYKFQDLTSWVRRASKLTPEEEDELLHMYERRKDSLREMAEKEEKKKRSLFGIEYVATE